MKAPISDGEVASALERLTVYYLDGWVKRHMIGIVKNGRVGHTLTNELFDALHNAYRWGVSDMQIHMQCASSMLLRFVRDVAANLRKASEG